MLEARPPRTCGFTTAQARRAPGMFAMLYSSVMVNYIFHLAHTGPGRTATITEIVHRRSSFHGVMQCTAMCRLGVLVTFPSTT